MNFQPPDRQTIDALFDSPPPVPPNTYEIALVLGGTVASGAYTAGVMDFLIEALDNWTQRRDAGDKTVPQHEVVIRVITGASGGAVNAAIAARALAYRFPPVSRATPAEIAATNPLYDTWVNRLTLQNMLSTDDLDAPGSKPTSLLNGRAVDEAAARAVAFAAPAGPARRYLASPLRLIFTLTNLNGMPYRLDFGSAAVPGGGSVDLAERFVDHADYIRFAVVYPGNDLAAPRPDELVLGFNNGKVAQTIGWPEFGQFACASAAFPIGFPPRRLTRPLSHYQYRVVSIPAGSNAGATTSEALVPDWAAIQEWAGGGLPADYQFLAVDAGATDNEPIELARTALAGITGRNPRDGMAATRGVVLIDPFAGAAGMAPPLSLALPDLVEALGAAMIQQTRYDTRDLLLASYPDVYSRFMIAGIRGSQSGDLALATSGLGAFIGFACESFRRHDYLLGRKNCQDFLKGTLVLPQASPIFAGRLDGVTLSDYLATDPSNATFLPIIPLVGSARIPETLDPWPKNALDPESLRPAIEARFARLLEKEIGNGPLSSALSWIVAKLGETKMADIVVGAMRDSLRKWQLM